MREMESGLRALSDWLGAYGWVVDAALSAVFTVAALAGWVFAHRLLSRQAARTTTPWDNIVLRAANAPAIVLVVLLGAHNIIEAAADALPDGAALGDAFGQARSVALVAGVFWFALRIISGGERHYRNRTLRIGEKAVDAGSIHAVFRVLRAVVFFIAALMILESLGVSVSGILAFGGVGGIIVGLAAKDMLGNFFSGMVIFWERPFVLGDWIRCPAANIEGVVKHIGWRVTELETFDKRPLYVPNAIFVDNIIENPQRMTNRRIYEYAGLRYDDIGKLPAVLSDVREMLQTRDDIDAEKTLMVGFDRYGASSVDFFIYAFTTTTDWIEFHRIKGEVLLEIAAIVQKHGAEFAFPTRTVHHDFAPTHPAHSGASGIPGVNESVRIKAAKAAGTE